MRWFESNSRLAVAIRRLRSRYGIASPSVTIRSHLPWPLRLLATLVGIAIAAAFGAYLYDYGRHLLFPAEKDLVIVLGKLQAEYDALSQQCEIYKRASEGSSSSLEIERTAMRELSEKIKILEMENVRLRDELALFETLANGAGKGEGVTVNKFRVETGDTPGTYRWRALLVKQGGKKEREFRGEYQLVVSYRPAGASEVIGSPAKLIRDTGEWIDLNFKHFQRVEGSFELREGAELTSAELNLRQSKKVVAQAQATL